MEKFAKEWIDMVEKNTEKMMNEMVKSQNFMKNLMATYEPLMNTAKGMKDAQKSFYETAGIASKDDLVKISQKIHDVEIKMADIEEKVDQVLDNQQNIMKALSTEKKAAPKRTAKTNTK